MISADKVWFIVGNAKYKLSEWIGGMVPLGTAADKYLYTTAPKTWAEGDITSFGRDWLAAADNEAAQDLLPEPPEIPFPAGYIFGLTLANNGTDATNDIDIAAGKARDGTDTQNIILPSALTKRLDATWAAGTNQGMRNSASDGGSIANRTYHLFLVAKADGADPDIYASHDASESNAVTAIQSETGGADYDYARRIGSIVRSSGAILAFRQTGDEFLYITPLTDVNGATVGTSRSLHTLTVPPDTSALIRGSFLDATANILLVLQPTFETDAAPAATTPGFTFRNPNAGVSHGGELNIRVDASSQVAARSSDAGGTMSIVTKGYIDRRGRDA